MPLQALAFHHVHGAKVCEPSVLIVIPSSEQCLFVNTPQLLSPGHRLSGNLYSDVGIFAVWQMQKLGYVQVTHAGGKWSEMWSLICEV